MSAPPRPRAQRPSPNRERLVAAARAAIAEKGYAGAGTEEIVRRAGVTRGALYYQFADKRDLFRAVCGAVMEDLARRLYDETMGRAVREEDELRIGCRLLLDAYSEPGIRRVLLVEGPAVLGLEEWRALQEPVSLGLLTHALEHLAEAGRIAPEEIGPLAQLLFGALVQAGVALGAAPDPAAARAAYARSLDALVAGIEAGRAGGGADPA